MKPDLYTKAVLTVIAMMLVVIACNLYVNPKTVVQAQGTGLQFAAGPCVYYYTFDPRSGTVSRYDCGTGKLSIDGKVTLH
jgi:hypothetical protein